MLIINILYGYVDISTDGFKTCTVIKLNDNNKIVPKYNDKIFDIDILSSISDKLNYVCVQHLCKKLKKGYFKELNQNKHLLHK